MTGRLVQLEGQNGKDHGGNTHTQQPMTHGWIVGSFDGWMDGWMD